MIKLACHKTLLILLLLLPAFLVQANPNPAKPEFKTWMMEVLTKLESHYANRNDPEDKVKPMLTFCMEKVRKGEILLEFDPSLGQDFWNCMTVRQSESAPGKLVFAVGQFAQDKYDRYPLLINCAILRNFQLIWFYYNDPELLNSAETDPFAAVMYSMVPLNQAALYLGTILTGNEYYGPYEDLLGEGLFSGLQEAGAIFTQTDLGLMHYMEGLPRMEGQPESIYAALAAKGKSLLDVKQPNGVSESSDFAYIVALKTYLDLGPQTLFNIATYRGGVAPEEFTLEAFPENLAILQKVQEKLSKHLDILTYSEKKVAKFNAYYNEN
ncbi:MAG: hypothetical protein H6581_03785 [Bacteroidia bacterium]|nr:hypothetical protein [Bacteroidia bacterium]